MLQSMVEHDFDTLQVMCEENLHDKVSEMIKDVERKPLKLDLLNSEWHESLDKRPL